MCMSIGTFFHAAAHMTSCCLGAVESVYRAMNLYSPEQSW